MVTTSTSIGLSALSHARSAQRALVLRTRCKISHRKQAGNCHINTVITALLSSAELPMTKLYKVGQTSAAKLTLKNKLTILYFIPSQNRNRQTNGRTVLPIFKINIWQRKLGSKELFEDTHPRIILTDVFDAVPCSYWLGVDNNSQLVAPGLT